MSVDIRNEPAARSGTAFVPELVTARLAPVGLVVTAETTHADGLLITPRIRGGRLTGGWCLTHVASGRRVPTEQVDDVHRLHLIAGMVADLNWTDPDHGQYAAIHKARVEAAVCEVEQ